MTQHRNITAGEEPQEKRVVRCAGKRRSIFASSTSSGCAGSEGSEYESPLVYADPGSSNGYDPTRVDQCHPTSGFRASSTLLSKSPISGLASPALGLDVFLTAESLYAE